MVKLGWIETTIGALVDNKQISIQTGPFGTVLSASEYVDHGIPVISVREIRQGRIELFDETPAVSDYTYRKLPQFALKPYDLVFARKGNVDRSALIPRDTQKLFLGSDGIRLRFSDPTLAKIVFHHVQSSQTRQFLTVTAYGTTMAGLNETIISNIPICIPAISNEQQRIAEALSDMDELIFSLEKLIEKKKAIKQGAMQELLTGKRRLPGFSGKWERFNLMKRSKIKARIGWQGLKKDEYLESGYAYLVTGTDFDNGIVHWNSCRYVDKERYDADCNIQLKNDDLLITKDGSLGKTALVKGLNYPATLNSGVFVIRPLNSAYDSAFAYYILSSFIFRDFLDKLSAGSTITHLYQKDLDKFEFLLPPTEQEQKAIATVLSIIDTEIQSLEHKCTKAHQIKNGMMQQLLTGKIRV